jgi:proteasome subunit B (beta)-like protein
MTVCIGAISSTLGVIVTVSDMMLSTDTDSVEAAEVKFDTIVRGPRPWVCLYAGDPTAFDELRTQIQTKLVPARRRTCRDVMRVAEEAYEALIEHRIERDILSRFGLRRTEFIDTGLVKFGQIVFQQTMDSINQLLDTMRYTDATELLLAGFDDKDEPHIFSVNGIGHCTLHDGYAFHAIGVGSQAARGWLTAHQNFRNATELSEIAYRLCEAKFAAETAPFVGGRTTVLAALCSDGFADAMLIRQPEASGGRAQITITSRPSPSVIELRGEVIRAAYEERRNQPLPQDAVGAINAGLDRVVKQLEENRNFQHETRATPPLVPDLTQTEHREE